MFIDLNTRSKFIAYLEWKVNWEITQSKIFCLSVPFFFSCTVIRNDSKRNRRKPRNRITNDDETDFEDTKSKCNKKKSLTKSHANIAWDDKKKCHEKSAIGKRIKAKRKPKPNNPLYFHLIDLTCKKNTHTDRTHTNKSVHWGWMFKKQWEDETQKEDYVAAYSSFHSLLDFSSPFPFCFLFHLFHSLSWSP